MPPNVQLVSGQLVKECRNLRRERTCSNTYRARVISVPAGAGPAVGLQVQAVQAFPAGSAAVTFRVQGEGIKDIQVRIFNLAGRLVFHTDWVENGFGWKLQNNQGRRLANGVYLYVVTVRGYDGQVVRSEVRKLVVLR